jgi:hypothetical protein
VEPAGREGGARDQEPPRPVIVQVSPEYSDADIIDLMWQLRDAHLLRRQQFFTCALDGFNNDPRELGEIPEARALCRRLVDTGPDSTRRVTRTTRRDAP